MPGVRISEAVESDLPDIVRLYLELDEKIMSLENAKKNFNQIKSNPNHKIYIAKEANEIIGTFAMIFINSFAHDGSPSAILEDVAVSGKHQGQGIGKQMMSFAMERAKEKGCYKIALSSQFKREGAHKFYESLGFERMGYSFVVELAEKVSELLTHQKDKNFFKRYE